MNTRSFRFGAAVLLLLSAAACERGAEAGAGAARQMPAAPVMVTTAKVADVPVTLTSVGSVIPLNTVSVQPRVGGPLIAVNVKDGQFVKAGDVLFAIDPAIYQVAVDQAKAKLAQDEATLKLDQLNEERAKALLEKKVGTQADYDTARYTSQAQAATVAASKAALDAAQLDLGYTQIKAPMDGRAGAVLVQAGNIVSANGGGTSGGSGTSLLVINQISPIRVSFALDQKYFAPVMAAFHGKEPVAVTADINGDPAHPQTGTLTFIDNQLSSTTGLFTAYAVFDNPDHLLWPGQFVNVSMVVAQEHNRVVVPDRSIQMGQNGPYVFTVDDKNTAQMVWVKTGPEADGMTAIEDGLKAGATVVTDGMELRLFPGAKVEIKSSLQQSVEQVIGGKPGEGPAPDAATAAGKPGATTSPATAPAAEGK